ncbi:PorP/SprF family type IX secretion system membrane protein [Croceivirga thetidis]|uniref:Type IX secretion system membrane protein PorP/SprF n=1 Tax=Croceivirga thetidis TaxID=2721623 RepID=A0ABX1GVA0_9FLAO|nr:type IX secretion system membrane protein PorP/SprF [Croceivirga thetidis]NKI32920.1 type IX secretion system membrane protein PorP/SprF [Croceivirga thetidis]
MKKTIFFVLVASLFTGQLMGQQEAQYTQYMYNTLAINPAYAGSRGGLSIAGLHRSQWVGLDGAPVTQTLNAHSPVGERVGIGLSIINDNIGNGTSQETSFDGIFSYTIPVSVDGNLSFGLKAGGHLLNIDLSRLQNQDPTFNTGQQVVVDNKFSPNFGLGAYYYTDTFYAGISAPNILETEHFDSSGQNANLLARERLNFYIISGIVRELSEDFKFKPAVLLRGVSGAPLQVDLSANFMYQEKFTLGAAYRFGAAWSALAGYQLNDSLMLGLAYDKETTELGSTAFNNGSFEVFLRYEVFNLSAKEKTTMPRRVLTPRFF